MAKEAKILSFDEAKRTTGASRPSVSVSKKALKSAKPSKRQASKVGKSAAFPRPQALFVSRTAPTARKPQAVRKQNVSSTLRASRAANAFQAAPTNHVARASQTTRRSQTAQSSQTAERLKTAAKPKMVSLRSPRPSVRKAEPSQTCVGGRGRKTLVPQSVQASRSEPEKKRESWLTRLRRERVKAKVDRTFGKQYGDMDKPSDASQTGPRAALYKGEMGSTQRRASRMQGNDTGLATDSSAKRTVKGHGIASRLIAGAAVAACIVLTCAFLYPTAQQYYVNVRECDRLQAEYDAVTQRNAVIQSEVNSLSTDAGIEDRAREEFGWVKAGEYAVNVYGVEQAESESMFLANIKTGSVEAPETWYSVLLDPLFGVE